jgi:hypothetical protein
MTRSAAQADLRTPAECASNNFGGLKGDARFLAPIDQARGGDVKAFAELTRRFQRASYGSALALVRDFQAAENVVQDAFLAAWSGLPSLAESAAFRPRAQAAEFLRPAGFLR